VRARPGRRRISGDRVRDHERQQDYARHDQDRKDDPPRYEDDQLLSGFRV
jgi:hypothetical protein